MSEEKFDQQVFRVEIEYRPRAFYYQGQKKIKCTPETCDGVESGLESDPRVTVCKIEETRDIESPTGFWAAHWRGSEYFVAVSTKRESCVLEAYRTMGRKQNLNDLLVVPCSAEFYERVLNYGGDVDDWVVMNDVICLVKDHGEVRLLKHP